MLVVIVGDIVGARFEFNNHRSKDFDLFAEGCFATDDSIMTLAVAKAIMEVEKQVNWLPENRHYEDMVGELLGDCAVRYMQEIGRHYGSYQVEARDSFVNQRVMLGVGYSF